MQKNTDLQKAQYLKTRRDFLRTTAKGLGAMAIGSLLVPDFMTGQHLPVGQGGNPSLDGGILKALHHSPRAKRVIYLFQSGAPSQLDLFDYKPLLQKMHGEDLPESIRQGQRLTGMTAYQKNLPLKAAPYGFQQHGKSKTWMNLQKSRLKRTEKERERYASKI